MQIHINRFGSGSAALR